MKTTIREIIFVSNNKSKAAEARAILSPLGIDVVILTKKVHEIQTSDSGKLIRDKAIKAFDNFRAPLFVEHTSLCLNYLNGLPGGLTEVFWESLGADKFSEIFGNNSDPRAFAETRVGFIDGKKFHDFDGRIDGKISRSPSGPREFEWDCVFVPDGQTQTFAEMGPEQKNRISMRQKALLKFSKHLQGEKC